MTAIQISVEENEHGGRYLARVAGRDGVGELVFVRLGPDLINAAHTEVPASLGGLGVGRVLVEHLVAEARSRGFRVIPGCSFVAAQAKRHPDWADVFVSG